MRGFCDSGSALQAQAPFKQTSELEQLWPQLPQLFLFVLVSTQSFPPHSVLPVGQVVQVFRKHSLSQKYTPVLHFWKPESLTFFLYNSHFLLPGAKEKLAHAALERHLSRHATLSAVVLVPMQAPLLTLPCWLHVLYAGAGDTGYTEHEGGGVACDGKTSNASRHAVRSTLHHIAR